MNFINRIKSIIYYKVFQPAYNNTIGFRKKVYAVKNKYKIEKNRNNIVILGTPNHGNLGDYAINVAERQLFADTFPDWNIFEVDLTDFPKEIHALGKILSCKDILVLTGGGNLGNQYMDDENVRRETIRLFPQNRIYIFPQTCYFTKDTGGNEEKKKTEDIYNKHRHLFIMARDRQSFEEMKAMFRAPVRLMPDVVLTMKTDIGKERKGAVILLRNDIERKYTEEQEKKIESILKKYYTDIERTDTEISSSEFLKNKDGCFKDKLAQIGKAEVVVTDRLHGMVFSAITETPCIVLDNYNHKVRETYRWISHLPYIKYLTDISLLEDMVNELKSQKKYFYENEEISGLYQKLMQEIKNG